MFRFDSLGGTVNYATGAVDLDVRLQQNPMQWLTAKGRAPMTLFQPAADDASNGHTDASGSDAVNIQVESSPIDLGLIQSFTSYVTNVTGMLQANVKVTGSGHDPHLDGAVDVRNGAFEVPELGTSYSGLDTRIELTPEAVKISEMKIVDNHGSPMTVGGELAVHGRSVGGVQITMQSENFKVIDNDLGNVRLDTDLRLTGEVRAPKLEGSVNVNTGTLDVAKILEQVTADAYSTTATELPTENPISAHEKVTGQRGDSGRGGHDEAGSRGGHCTERDQGRTTDGRPTACSHHRGGDTKTVRFADTGSQAWRTRRPRAERAGSQGVQRRHQSWRYGRDRRR